MHNSYGAPPEKLARIPHQSHEMNWVNAIRGREEIGCPFSYAAHLTEIMLLGVAALRAGTKLRYDGANMRFTNNDGANEFLTRPIGRDSRSDDYIWGLGDLRRDLGIWRFSALDQIPKSTNPPSGDLPIASGASVCCSAPLWRMKEERQQDRRAEGRCRRHQEETPEVHHATAHERLADQLRAQEVGHERAESQDHHVEQPCALERTSFGKNSSTKM